MSKPSPGGHANGAPTHVSAIAGLIHRPVLLLAVLLVVVIGLLFRESFHPDMAMFANDGPLGLVAAACNQLPEAWTGIWADLNWVGLNGGGSPADLTSILAWLLGPLAFIKFYPAITIIILGLAAGLFLRQLGLHPVAAVLGGLAAALNSDFFSYACWGLGTLTLCVAAVFLALTALAARRLPAWLRVTLAGAALGLALLEGFDNGAIFSVYLAAYVVASALIHRDDRSLARSLQGGIAATAGVAVVSAIAAAHILITLVQANISGAVGMGQDRESTAARWNFVTHWSLPPKETLRTVIPGLYGYRMDTPGGGQYWGHVGMHPAWDEYWASRERSPDKAPREMLRYSGAGHYAGVVVVLLAAFAVTQSFRRTSTALTPEDRRWIWFWAGVALVSLLFAFGRFAPFYRIVFAMPYFNTIRNPVKFLHPFGLSLVVLCAYGVHALWRGWIERGPTSRDGVSDALKNWWSRAAVADRRWATSTIVLTGMAVIAWFIYGASRASLVAHLGETGFTEEQARAIARFSHQEVGWFVLTLGISVFLMLLALSGWLSGQRARMAAVILGFVLVADLARANLPWILHYNWRDRYATNPLFDQLRAAPHLGRVTGRMPFSLPGESGAIQSSLSSVYEVEWHQHQFRYYNIQTIDIVQMPRFPADYDAYWRALDPHPIRKWELGNTRYLLSLAPLVGPMNQQLDAERKRFRLHTAFTLSQTADGVIELQTNAAGPFGLIEFTGALPRAMLFDRWRSQVADDDALQVLAAPEFNPHAEVLVAEQIPPPAVDTTTQPAGTAVYRSYSPKQFVIETESRTPCVLLVNDKHDPNWVVDVDGREEPLLRANFIMRGVLLEPGKHVVTFRFAPPMGWLWVSVSALALSLVLSAYAVVLHRRPTPLPG